jgi:hypothetical protein
MTSRERTKRYRETQKHEEYETVHYGSGNEHRDELCNEPVTNRYTDKDKDIDIDKDKDKDKRENARSDFADYQKVWEQETGKMVTGFTEFSKMCKRFQDVGVTPEIYRTAIQEQQNSQYAVKRPTGVQEWAVRLVADKQTAKVEKTNQEIIQEMIANGEL